MSAVVLVVIQSMATRKRIGENAPLSHSGLHGEPLREVISHDDTTLKMFIECFYDKDDF